MAHEIKWRAWNRRHASHAADWYIAVVIIAVSIAITSVLLHNTLFAILVVISTVVLFLRSLQRPVEIAYALTSKGLWVEKAFTPFKSFDSFFIDDTDSETPLLILKSIGLIMPLLCIPLGSADREEVRAHLSTILPEVEHHEPLSKRIMEYLGF